MKSYLFKGWNAVRISYCKFVLRTYCDTARPYMSRKIKETNPFKSLATVYDFSPKEITTIRKAFQTQEPLNTSRLHEISTHLKGLGFSKEDIAKHPQILTLSVHEMNSRLDYFQESGATCDARLMIWFDILVQQSVVNLKAGGIFADGCNLPKTILSNVDSNLYEQYKPSNELSSFMDVHWDVTLFYLRSYFGDVLEEQLNKINKRKPLTHIVQLISLFTEKMQFDAEWLKTHFEVLNSNPDNVSKMLVCDFPLELDIQEILQRKSSVAALDLPNILNVLEVFQDFNISKHDVMNHLSLLRESPVTIRENIITFFKLEELSYMSPLDAISVPNFQRKALSIFQNNYKTSELTRFLANTHRKLAKHLPVLLAREFQMDVKVIRCLLEKHPNWLQAKYTNVTETLTLLKSYGYTTEEIKSCLIILLYPRSIVDQKLQWFKKNETDLFKNSTFRLRHLHLILYYIEKDNQFSWDIVQDENNSLDENILKEDDEVLVTQRNQI